MGVHPAASNHEEVYTREDIQVRFEFYRDSNHLITSHWHNSMEIVYLYEGCMDVGINNRNIILNKNDFVIINSADVHSTYCHENCRVILLQIPYDFLKKTIPEYDQLRFERNEATAERKEKSVNDRIQSILIDMMHLNRNKPVGYSLRFGSLLYDLLYLILNHFSLQVDSSLKIRTEKNLLRLHAVMEYIKAHYSSNIALEDAALVINLNPEYFCRFFKKYMGITFLEYLNKVRLAHVFEDLIHTDLSVTEILSRNGCNNYKLFMRNFKKTYGCTPLAMRKYQKDNQFLSD